MDIEILSVPLKGWLNILFSFKYIGNFVIIIATLAYYMNAMSIFFVLVPLIIVNFIVMSIIQILELDELIKGMLGYYLKNNNDINNIYTEFVVITSLWYLFGVFWVYMVTGDNIKLYKPNFMKMFLISLVILILYKINENKYKIYGNINYLRYFIISIIVLLTVCIKLYY